MPRCDKLLFSIFLFWSTATAVAGPAGWTASEGLAVDLDVVVPSGDGLVGWVADRAMLLSGLQNLQGYAVTVSNGFGDTASRTQFGANSSGPLVLDRVLATSSDGMVVSGIEHFGDNKTRSFAAFLDAQGQLLWALPGWVSDAKLLDGNLIVLRRGSALRGLDRLSGALLWSRELNDLFPYTYQTSVTLSSTASYPLLLKVTNFIAEQVHETPVVLNLDPHSGQTVWQWAVHNELQLAYASCGIVEVAGDLIIPWLTRDGSTDLYVERRQAADGTLIWRASVPDLAYENGPCGLVANADVVALSSYDSVATEFVGLDASTGVQRWRSALPIFGVSQLFDLGPGGLLLVPPSNGSLPGLPVQSFRSSDGQLQWQQILPEGGRLAVRVAAAGIELARADYGASSVQLALWRLQPASGAILTQRTEAATAMRSLPGSAKFIDRIPYLVGAGRGLDGRGIYLRRLDPISGEQVWERSFILPSAADSIESVYLYSGGGDAVIVAVAYVPLDQVSSNLSKSVLMRVDASGTLTYQRSFNKSRGGYAGWPLAHPSGELSFRLVECGDPPTCDSNLSTLIRLDLNGTERWRFDGSTEILSALGESILFRDSDSGTIPLYAADGSERWHLGPEDNSMPWSAIDAGSVYAYALARFGDDFEQFEVRGLSPSTGEVVWTDSPPGPPGSHSDYGSSFLLPGTNELLTSVITHVHVGALSRRDTSMLVKHQVDNGQRLALSAPDARVDVRRTLGGPLSVTADPLWMRGIRILDNYWESEQTRYSVARIDPDSLEVIADYQLQRDFDSAVLDPGLFRPVGVAVNGQIWIESRSNESDGVTRNQLQVFPPVSDTKIDLQLSILDFESPLRALGPSRQVKLRLVNSGPDRAQDAIVQAASPVGETWALLSNCDLVGTGSCPALLDTGAAQSIALDSGSEMTLTYEVYALGFKPQRRGERREILFVVDPAPGVGDRDLGDNVVRGEISLGGFGNGFE